MKTSIHRTDNWSELNADLSKILDQNAKLYPSTEHAVFEVVMAAAEIFSHKKNVGLVNGTTPFFQAALKNLYRKGFSVQITPQKDLTDAKSWVEALKKDTALVFFTEDHPVTGEIYPWQELDELLNGKKIFAIRLSHNTHFFERSELKSFSARMADVSESMAYMSAGARFNPPDLFASEIKWPSQFKLDLSLREQKKDLILGFEKKCEPFMTPFFSHENRIFDRAVIYDESLNADAVRHFLIENLKRSHPQIQDLESKIMTTSPCFWKTSKLLFENWWKPMPADKILRGLLVIDCEVIEKVPDLESNLKQSCEQCRLG